MVATAGSDVRVRVHERGDSSLDGILRLIELAASDRPLEELLGAMCIDIAAIAGADIASVYVRERAPDDELLTLRGNVGFPAAAIGSVRLRVGEGISGFAAECLRPVSVARAPRDAHYKHVPGLGEEQYPAFLAVPLLHGARASGVLVLQRRQALAFIGSEIALATALAAPIGFAIENAHRRAREGTGSEASRAARLRGVTVAPGAALGRAAMIPTLEALASQSNEESLTGADPSILMALAGLESDLARARKRLEASGAAEVGRALSNLTLALQDERFRQRVVSGLGADLTRRLSAVAKDYARVPYRVVSREVLMEVSLAERAREIEDLCVLLHAAAHGRQRLRTGEVWIATERLGAFVALAAVARRASAIVVDGHVAADAPGAIIAKAGGVPVLAQVSGLYAWVRAQDLVIVDGDSGTLTVNPSATAVARHRKRTR